MKQITYFAVMRNSDTTEGRGPLLQSDVGFEKYDDAITFVASDAYSKWAVMGVKVGRKSADHLVKEVTITVYTDADECEALYPELVQLRKRKAALAKLSPADREILGLD